MKVIRQFRGDYEFLSNFYPSWVTYAGKEYPTVEHAFQAAKTLNHLMRKQIREASTPGIAKRMGRKVTLREDWEAIKVIVMLNLVQQKFTMNKALRKRLLATDDAELMEGNRWGDTFWGVDIKTGEGKNELGRILMNVRIRLREGML